MIPKTRRNRFVTSLIALLAALALASAPAQAQTKPFKITGEGVAPLGLPLPGQPARPHSIVGNATQLGRHVGAGTVETDTVAFDPATNTFSGEFGSGSPFRFVGADGDILSCQYGRTDAGASKPGTFKLTIVDVLPDGSLVVVALFIAEFVPVSAECTGKFAGVTGSWVMVALTDPFVLGSMDPTPYSWQGQGSLTYKKGK
jgi:hypothetical protein